MNRRGFISNLSKTGLISCAGVGTLLQASAANNKELPNFKHFKLLFPQSYKPVEAQAIMNKFWDFDKMNQIQRDFQKKGKILFMNHKLGKGAAESLVVFSSESAYQEWEEAIASENCCNDSLLNQSGFRFSMTGFSLDSKLA